MKILIIPLLLLLSGCNWFVKETIVDNYVYVPVTCPEFIKPAPIITMPVQFVQAVDTEGNQVLGLRGDQYSNLAINSADTLRYIIEQKSAISYYRGCIENHNSVRLNEEGEPE